MELKFKRIAKEKSEEENYRITFKKLSIDKRGYIEAEDVIVYRNGEKTTDLGSNWAGSYHYSPDDVLESVIMGYINDNRLLIFEDVPKRIQSLKKRFFRSKLTISDREIPVYYYTNYLNKKLAPKIRLITNNCAAYVSPDDEWILTDSEEGSVMSDIEAFVSGGMLDEYAENKDRNGVLYVDKLTKTWLNDWLKVRKTV